MNPISAGVDGLVTGAAWWSRIFAAIDSADAEGFAGFLADDAHFRVGNAPTMIGRNAIRVAVAGFFGTVASSQHRLHYIWDGIGSTVCEGEVTYGRHDGSSVTLPFVNVLCLEDTKIASYRIYIDNSPLFAKAV
jgi:ketosteroid isomerase-like protein